MRYVIAIDVGIKNLGLCIFDFISAQFVHWDTVSLVPNGHYQPALNVQYVRDFITRYEWAFSQAAAVLVERQMRCNMRIIEAVFQALYFPITHVIHARSVKAHYNLSTKNYRLNKQKAVQWAENFVQNNKSVFDVAALANFDIKTKRDDLADALLLVAYYLDTYSNQYTGFVTDGRLFE